MKRFLRQVISLIIALIIVFGFFFILHANNADAQVNSFPKLANYYLGWDIDQKTATELAKWDVVVISNAAYTRQPWVPAKLRELNPDITLLVYVGAQEASDFAPTLENGNFFREMYEVADQNDWWLYTSNGQKISTWPQNYWINLSLPSFSDWLARRTAEKFLSDNTFDGVFYDNIFETIHWASPNIDIDRDGRADSASVVNARWQEGVRNLIAQTERYAPNKLVVANANSNFYNNTLDGRLHEHFPRIDEGGWLGSTYNYLNNNLSGSKIFIINANNSNVNDPLHNLKNFRFTYTTSLLGDGFFSFDAGDQSHSETWWFDEYEVFLGRAVNGIENLTGPDSPIRNGLWVREFENGFVFVNATDERQTVDLDTELEKIRGAQAPKVNNGAIVRKITLDPNDGIVLQKRISEVVDAPYLNGSFVRPFNKYGELTDRNGFFIFDRQTAGNQWVAKTDLEGDGSREKIVADDYKITIYNADNTVRKVIYPYGPSSPSSSSFDIADMDGDGDQEIVTGPGRGVEPLVKIYDHNGSELHSGFHAYNQNYRGGVNVAFADLNGNGRKDIVVGAGYLGGPQVRIFNYEGLLVSGGFFAYGENFRGGVNVAAGDIDGDGIDEIITGAGYGGSTHVQMFNGKFHRLNPGFFAFGETSRQGVQVFVADLDGNGKDEILAANPNPFN